MEECDIVILLFACYTVEKYKRQMELINQTWGKVCHAYNIKMLYCLGEEKREGFQDTPFIKYLNLEGVQNDYLSASYKQFLGLKYIQEHYCAKFIYCAGTDTYVNVPKLARYVQSFSPNEYLYIGGDGSERQIGDTLCYYHSGGAGFLITPPCLKRLYDTLPTLMDEWTTLCTVHQVQHLIPACDVSISYYLQQIKELTIVTQNEFFLQSNYQGWPWRTGQVDMKKIICCHFMGEQNFLDYTKILQQNHYFLTN